MQHDEHISWWPAQVSGSRGRTACDKGAFGSSVWFGSWARTQALTAKAELLLLPLGMLICHNVALDCSADNVQVQHDGQVACTQPLAVRGEQHSLMSPGDRDAHLPPA